MLMDHGMHTGLEDWYVQEKIGCGYVRVYDVKSGTARYRDQKREFCLPAGKICMFPSVIPYSVTQDPNDWFTCNFVHLNIAPALLREPLILDAEPGSAERGIFDAAGAALQKHDEPFLFALFEAFEIYCHSQNLFSMPEGELVQPLEALSANFQKNWTISELSQMAGYSEPYFIRRFRSETGVSPHQYLIARRMKEALRLLWRGDSVSSVADQIGYTELKAFSRAFHQWYGISPSQYRESGKLYP